MNRTAPRTRTARTARRASTVLSLATAATLLTPTLSACVFVPAAVQNAEQRAEQIIETPEVKEETETEKPAEAKPTQTPEPEPKPVALSPEDKYLEEVADAFYLPVLTPSLEDQILEVGYSACDIYAEGIAKDFIIIVMEDAIAPYPDVYTPRAATIITDAALTHLC